MGFNDWNGNGKNDFFDDYIDYKLSSSDEYDGYDEEDDDYDDYDDLDGDDTYNYCLNGVTFRQTNDTFPKENKSDDNDNVLMIQIVASIILTFIILMIFLPK